MNLRTPLLALLALTVAVAGRATSLVHLSLAQLSRASAVIVQGRATRQEYGWNTDHSMIVTLTTIAVEHVEKGHPPTTLVVEQPGGVMGNMQMRMDGTAGFYPLASYVLFLEPSHSGAGRFMPVGMMQGAFRIYRDADTGIDHVIPPVQGTWAETSGAHPMTAAMMPTLSQFERRVQGIGDSPMQIPRGVALRVTLTPGWNQGQGSRARAASRAGVPARERCSSGRDGRATPSRAVEARTIGTAFPNSDLVIPAGSTLAGDACRVKNGWRIRWTALDVRGARAKFVAVSNLGAGSRLNGALLNVVAE